MLVPDPSELGRAILARTDVGQLERIAIETGMITRWDRACQAVEAGLTAPAEVDPRPPPVVASNLDRAPARRHL